MKAGRIIGTAAVVYILSTLIVRGIYLEALAIFYFLFCFVCDHAFSEKRFERERLLDIVVWLITEIIIGIVLSITVYKEKEPLLLIEIFLGFGFLGIPEIVRIIALVRNMRKEKK